jgi:hypothetical protein
MSARPRPAQPPLPELLNLVRALARADAEADHATHLAKQPPEGRQAAA